MNENERRVQVTQTVTLTRQQVWEIFNRQLAELTSDFFIRDGRLMRTIDMQGRGSDIEEVVGSVADDEFIIPVTALKLKALVANICPNRYAGNGPQEHRFSERKPETRCVDCNQMDYRR